MVPSRALNAQTFLAQRLPGGYHYVRVYTARILKGASPGDLPVIEAAKIARNLKTAKALGLSFLLPSLGRADEVIE